MKKLYVGNLPYRATESEIQEMFAQFGTVHSVNLISDRETGRAKGFGFVEMDDEGARVAVEELNGKQFGGRDLKVNEARPREERERRPRRTF